MAFQTPFLFYEYKTEKLGFFKIDHARRQKINGSRLYLKTTCVRQLGVNDSWVMSHDSILKTSIYDSMILYWMRGRIIIVALYSDWK